MPKRPFRASALRDTAMSIRGMMSPMGTKAWELIPSSPMLPEAFPTQPGMPRVNFQGSASVGTGSFVSLESTTGAPAREMALDAMSKAKAMTFALRMNEFVGVFIVEADLTYGMDLACHRERQAG